MLIWASSGRLRAAARKVSILFARSSASPPERSSRTKLMSPEAPAPGNGRRRKGKSDGFRQPGQLAVQSSFDFLIKFILLLPFFPGCSVTKKKPL